MLGHEGIDAGEHFPGFAPIGFTQMIFECGKKLLADFLRSLGGEVGLTKLEGACEGFRGIFEFGEAQRFERVEHAQYSGHGPRFHGLAQGLLASAENFHLQAGTLGFGVGIGGVELFNGPRNFQGAGVVAAHDGFAKILVDSVVGGNSLRVKKIESLRRVREQGRRGVETLLFANGIPLLENRLQSGRLVQNRRRGFRHEQGLEFLAAIENFADLLQTGVHLGAFLGKIRRQSRVGRSVLEGALNFLEKGFGGSHGEGGGLVKTPGA